MIMNSGLKALSVCCAAMAAALVNAGQPTFSLFDVLLRDGREVQRLLDSDVIPMACTPSIGTERVAVEVGQEWKLAKLRLPHRFVSLHTPDVPENPGLNDGVDYRNEYLNLDTLIAQYDQLVVDHPTIVSKQQIGTSHNARPIYAYRIYKQDLYDVFKPKQAIVITGGIHAREWISPAVTLHVAKMTADTLATVDNSFTERLVDRAALYVIPVLNPDGYAYTWTNNRLWRKNRRNNGNNIYGVDLNRNYGTAWGGAGSSGSPSSETYRGPSAFSEPETSSLRNFVNTLGNKVLFIDYHSYGQKILYPWSYTTDPCPHGPYMQTLGDAYKSTMITSGGLSYTVGQGAVTLYVASGSSKDWFYQQFTCASYTIELRNLNSFELPPAEITPTQDENWAGFQSMILGLNP